MSRGALARVGGWAKNGSRRHARRHAVTDLSGHQSPIQAEQERKVGLAGQHPQRGGRALEKGPHVAVAERLDNGQIADLRLPRDPWQQHAPGVLHAIPDIGGGGAGEAQVEECLVGVPKGQRDERLDVEPLVAFHGRTAPRQDRRVQEHKHATLAVGASRWPSQRGHRGGKNKTKAEAEDNGVASKPTKMVTPTQNCVSCRSIDANTIPGRPDIATGCAPHTTHVGLILRDQACDDRFRFLPRLHRHDGKSGVQLL